MKKLFTILLSLCFISVVQAQDAAIQDLKKQSEKTIKKEGDTTVKMWTKGGVFNLNLSQSSASNWAAGGDDYALSINSFVNLYALYKKGRHNWDNNLDISFGYINTTSLGRRKNDDRFNFTSKYGYELNPKLNLSGLFDFRTQMFKGYNYDNVNGTVVKTLTSDFLSPAYILLSPGLDYHPVKGLAIFGSPVTSRWTIMNNDSLSAKGLYGVEVGRHIQYEVGAYVSVTYKTKFNSIVGYKGRMDLFSNYKHNPQNIDIFVTNIFSAQLAKNISATWNFDLIYDDNTRLFGPNKNAPRLQVKSVIGAGLLIRL